MLQLRPASRRQTVPDTVQVPSESRQVENRMAFGVADMALLA